nr:EOG090X084E [Lepidurus arcticus]
MEVTVSADPHNPHYEGHVKLVDKGGVNLLNFIIINPSLPSPNDEENSKILYYYPPEADLDTQLRNVGRVEALIKFTGTFQPNGPLSCMHTQKTRQYFLEPEPDYWMIMVKILQNFCILAKYLNYYYYGTMVHQSDVLNDNVYQAILQQCYHMFRLFMNTFTSAVAIKDDIADLRPLRTRLNHFFPRYLVTVQLNSADISDAFQGIQFFPMDKLAFLKVHSLVNAIENEFPFVSHSVVLYQEQLIWSALAKSDMQIFYQYLVTSLLPSHRDSPSSKTRFTRSLCGSLQTAWSLSRIIHRRFSFDVPLSYLDITTPISLEIYQTLDAYLNSRVTHIAAELQDQLRPNNCTSFRFIYFNRLNLAGKMPIPNAFLIFFRGTLRKFTCHFSLNSQLSNSTHNLKLITRTNKREKRLRNYETITKLRNDYEIKSKSSGMRNFLQLLQNLQNTLLLLIHTQSTLV